MVSTRGVKLKFFEGERVLCYEPDPTKAKVLYDSKVKLNLPLFGHNFMKNGTGFRCDSKQGPQREEIHRVSNSFPGKNIIVASVTVFIDNLCFKGWNSSWDRCVGEEYVLKDTVENRQLQKDLAEKSQLHM